MTIFDDSTMASTADICRLAGFTKQRLSALEHEGVVRRAGRGEWPLVATLNALFENLRTQRDAVSDTRREWEKVKVERERLRIDRERHEVVDRGEFTAAWTICWGIVVAKLVGVPARCTRDLQMRQTIGHELNLARHEACDEFERQAEALETSGEAAAVR